MRDWDDDSARRWAERKGFNKAKMAEFEDFLLFLKDVSVPTKDIKDSKHIDEGAFGSIDYASLYGKKCVVKRISKDVAGRKSLPQILRETLLELQIVKGLNHPNVVPFIGAALHFPTDIEPIQDLQLGLVFEWCEKTSLSKTLRKTTYSFHSKLRFAKEIASGMSYLHSLNILHRDLNTRNVLLTKDDKIKICDFGFARKISGPYDSTTISGTAEYMPPEQLTGKLLTLKADVWAMGTVMWELAAGKAPWAHLKGDIHQTLVKKVATNGERLARLTDKEVPEGPKGFRDGYIGLVEKTMHSDEKDRPTMAEVHKALKVLLKQMNMNSSPGMASFVVAVKSAFSTTGHVGEHYSGTQQTTFEVPKPKTPAPAPSARAAPPGASTPVTLPVPSASVTPASTKPSVTPTLGSQSAFTHTNGASTNRYVGGPPMPPSLPGSRYGAPPHFNGYAPGMGGPGMFMPGY